MASELFSLALHRPREMALRRWLFQIHLWTGVGLSLYFLLMGVTGVSLVFREEIEASLHAGLLRRSAPAAQAALRSPDDILASARLQISNERIHAIHLLLTPDATYTVVSERNNHYTAHYFDPVTGAYLGALKEDASFLRWLQLLHFDLLSGRPGRIVNGFGAALLLMMCATGVPLWWRGLRNWSEGLSIRWRASWKRVSWDLHQALGICVFLWLALMAVTGVNFAFGNQVRMLVGWVLPLSGHPPAPVVNAAQASRCLW